MVRIKQHTAQAPSARLYTLRELRATFTTGILSFSIEEEQLKNAK